MNLLLIHAMPHRFPDRVRTSREIGHLSVITEREAAGRHGADVDVEPVDNIKDLNEVRAAALAIFARRPIDQIISPFEFTIPAAAYLRAYFDLPGIDFDTATRFTHKHIMKRALAARGLPVAPFRVAYTVDGIAAAADALGWPVVIKPAVGGGCIDVSTLACRSDLDQLLASTASQQLRAANCPVVVEPFLEVTEEYHCEGVVHDGKVLFAAASRYLVPILRRRDEPHLSGSYCLPAGHHAVPEVRRLHDEAVRTLGLDSGVTHLEVLRTPAGFVIGEITCRIGGGGIVQNVRNQYGVDLWREWLLLALGRQPELPVVRTPGIRAYYQLPVRTGRLRTVTAAADLRAVSSVLSVETHLNAGEMVQQRRSSSVTPATVYLAVADEDELSDRVRTLGELTRLP